MELTCVYVQVEKGNMGMEFHAAKKNGSEILLAPKLVY